MHRDTATQDLERQFTKAMGHSIHFKLSWETVFSEPRRQGTPGKYVVISVSKNDLPDARSFFAKAFGNKLRDVAGRAVIYVPMAGSKPAQWLKCHDWQLDWQSNSIAKHFRDLPIDTVIGNTTTRLALQSFTAPGGNKGRIFTAVEKCRGGGTLLVCHGGQYANAMTIVMDLQAHLERVTGGSLPQHLVAKVARKTPGMGDSTVASESDNESLFSFITTSLDSRTLQAASAPKPSAWDKPMNEVLAPTYKFTSFSDTQQPPPPQAPPANPSVSDEDTASLQSIIAQLKIDNATSETKQKELQAQVAILQVSVSSLTTTSSLTPPDPSLAHVLTQFNQFTSVMTEMQSILEKTSSDIPVLAELSALIKSFPPSAGNQA